MGIYSCVPRCDGCDLRDSNFDNGPTCKVYMRPYAKWAKLGGCEGATHVKRQASIDSTRNRVGQQKQRKVKK